MTERDLRTVFKSLLLWFEGEATRILQLLWIENRSHSSSFRFFGGIQIPPTSRRCLAASPWSWMFPLLVHQSFPSVRFSGF